MEGTDENAPAPENKPAQDAQIPDQLAEKCEKCGKIILSDEMKENFGVCPKCGHYKKLSARDRIAMCAENFTELFADVIGENVLGFPGYDEKLASLRAKTGEQDGVVCGEGEIGGVRCALFSMDYRFMMGSMGHTVGEKITKTFEYATEHCLPVVGFVLSGGARMQEGIISLMQMAKTSAAVAKHSEAGLLYISVLTDPTTGGVSASFAFEADIIMAEKGALIGFAGPRVIEQTMRQKLPEGFQRAEFLEKKGFADLIVERREMKEKLAALLKFHATEMAQ
ncbi:MAG TPA: acetyl-CoA carboxylase, carboxyltransferase subunit beta [Candidatus Borkfalkia faecipullorum]|uniref:Acetyl-coenzyme A carboxylase carboxyl transferase subunit beta n=1 Tax=Candidatus Borkfalkia faecipullorum TaxID=2838510 RepID=A0A9D1V8F0_9FIRM|nr:acetyl-CoA carboxylase, carboxyltransferase subunit beta [Candidatus Borkfalkia faecipullorum]